jgi:NADH dehydrogenase FAD-containing subunit
LTEYASDIAWTYGTSTTDARWDGHQSPPKPKKVTLLSSSARILNRFLPWMHEEGVRQLQELGVEVITGSRADMSTLSDTTDHEKRTIKTLDGREIEAEVIVGYRRRGACE